MPGQKNLLSLHEAIVVALININTDTFEATFEEVANYISQQNLYPIRKGNVELAKQVELRSTKSKLRYSYLFKSVGNDRIRLALSPKSDSLDLLK